MVYSRIVFRVLVGCHRVVDVADAIVAAVVAVVVAVVVDVVVDVVCCDC